MDNLLTYPFVRKEEFENLELENVKLRKDYDKLFAELNDIRSMFDDNLLDLTKIIELSGKKTKGNEAEIEEIKKKLKEVTSIERLSRLTSDNIKFKVELNNKENMIKEINAQKGKLQDELQRMVKERELREDKDKKTIFAIRNVDDIMKQKLKENELLENKNNELKALNEQLKKELQKNALKLGYIKGDNSRGETPLISYSPRDAMYLSKKISKIKKLIRAKYFREKKLEKAKLLLFDVKQSVALMPEENKKHYEIIISQFDGVLN